MADIHPTAVVEKGAELGKGTRVGPFCLVGPHVRLGDEVVLHSHVVVTGHTTVGPRTQIYPFASIGHPPQDLKFKGEATTLVIGSDNIVREHATMNPGTVGGGGVTQVGNGCLFMIGAHVAHDCRIGDQVIMGNNAGVAGHVTVGDQAILAGHVAVHQFCRIGRNAMIGGMTGVDQDVIPYGLVIGERGRLLGLNVVGLKRKGVERAEIQRMNRAYETLFDGRATLAERVEELAANYGESAAVMEIVKFIREGTSRPLCQPKGAHAP